jgi:hypothetical protein
MNAKCKFTFLFQKILPKTDYNKALAFMGRHGLSSYPAPYVLDYNNRTVNLEFDNDKQMHYCMHNGKKLYFTSTFGKAQIIKLYKSLITEQDIRSAHRYVENYEDLKGITLLDVGSAEGIFTLDNIEKLEHAYLFEVEPFWIDALHATFEPWKEKVTIITQHLRSLGFTKYNIEVSILEETSLNESSTTLTNLRGQLAEVDTKINALESEAQSLSSEGA